ncbi:MAG: xanthine dehydrogenase molybdenum-binding subunit XdhA [Anaerococcus sp.]|nr:xanthine dehydrogenase molybdenum-binding subunit XdhA [Anaerococcus sp.]
MYVGKEVKRVDAADKVLGKAKYTEDLIPKNAYVAKILHATIAHGRVVSMDISKAEELEGVIKVITCFDVPKWGFPTAGHPWSLDEAHQDKADRRLLNTHVRYFGDDIGVVIAVDEITAKKALELIEVTYEEYGAVFDHMKAINGTDLPIHDDCPDNILAHTTNYRGDYKKVSQEEGLIKVEGWYKTPMLQHCHIENGIALAYEEDGKIVVVASTQLPHIVRRVCGQALGVDWGKIRVIKPYIGGGFGNKQDALYEPLCAFLTTKVGGHPVKLDTSREETFINTRTRHPMDIHIISFVRADGSFAARKIEVFAGNGAYASHGHSIAAKAMNCFHQQYPCDNVEADAYTIYTNLPVSGAMRGYGIPQAMFAGESHIDDVARALGMDPYDFREKNIMPKGYTDPFSRNVNYYDSFRECLAVGKKAIDYDSKKEAYKNQDGPIRRGVGMGTYWYNTGVYPISLETSSARMIVNQDGSVELQVGETEIGQGADTAFAQMTADALGLSFDKVHVISSQDTDVTPFGLGAYASRQTYMAGFAIRKTANILKEKILKAAGRVKDFAPETLDLVESYIVRKVDGKKIVSLEDLAMEVLYDPKDNEHFSAESTYTIRNNAYSFGASFAEVEVDINLGQVKILRLINIHDCGKLINPRLAEAQAHGGMSMAVGFALTEEMKYDNKGRVLNGNLLDYKLSTTMDHPNFEVYFVENPEPTSPFNTKSLGEPPTCSPAPAIRNAILNATGVGPNKAPMTPHLLIPLFKEAGLIEDDLGEEI